MPPVVVDPTRVHEFADAASFEAWLAAHWQSEPEVWIKIHKLSSGLATISPKEAIDVALCWGWIDAIRKSFDADSFLQRYTPRGKKSVWSQINVDNVARLTAAGRMQPSGLAQVEAAQRDGRWDNAYRMRDAAPPEDLLAALKAEPEALATYQALPSAERFACSFRTLAMRTETGRKNKIAELVAMLKRGEGPHSVAPSAKPKRRTKP